MPALERLMMTLLFMLCCAANFCSSLNSDSDLCNLVVVSKVAYLDSRVCVYVQKESNNHAGSHKLDTMPTYAPQHPQVSVWFNS